MRRALGEIAVSDLPSAIRTLWYTRNDEPQTEEFEFMPDWMDAEPPEPSQKRDLERVMAYLLTTLTEREAHLLIQRYWQDLTLEECGKKMGISGPRVRQIECNAIRKLRHPSRSSLLALVSSIPKTHIKNFDWVWMKYAGPSSEYIAWIRENPCKKVDAGLVMV